MCFDIQATLISLHPNEHSQEFCYNSFAVKSDRSVGSCNTRNDYSNKLCLSNKTEDVNLSLFNMITGIRNTPNDYSNKVCVSNKPDDMNLSLFNMITGIN